MQRYNPSPNASNAIPLPQLISHLILKNQPYKTSTSPLPQAPLTPSHLTAQTSPILNTVPSTSTSTPSPGGTTTLTSSTRHLTKTTSFPSGP